MFVFAFTFAFVFAFYCIALQYAIVEIFYLSRRARANMQQANQSRLPAASNENSEYYSNSTFDIFDVLGPGRTLAGGPSMDRWAVTSSRFVKISRLASRLRRSARRGPDPTAVLIKHDNI